MFIRVHSNISQSVNVVQPKIHRQHAAQPGTHIVANTCRPKNIPIDYFAYVTDAAKELGSKNPHTLRLVPSVTDMGCLLIEKFNGCSCLINRRNGIACPEFLDARKLHVVSHTIRRMSTAYATPKLNRSPVSIALDCGGFTIRQFSDYQHKIK